jgi:hypothetical protein
MLRQWQQMLALFDHRRSHQLGAPGDLALFVVAARGQQLYVQLLEISCLGDRNPVRSAKIAGFALDTAFFVGLVG